MGFKKANPDTHQECRSLLQKAVRRGAPALVEKVVFHLNQIGDKSWLKNRTAIITYEECWPLAQDLSDVVDMVDISEHLKKVSRSIKNKDAAGLGSLAYEYHQGSREVLDFVLDFNSFWTVANALNNPEDFWSRMISETDRSERKKNLLAAKKVYSGSGWPWDKAFIIAGAHLAQDENPPPADEVEDEIAMSDFPYWVALDKHTSMGKKIIRETAKKVDISASTLSWINFYFESVLTNQSTYSPWWQAEMQWRLDSMGLTEAEAEQTWIEVKHIYQEIAAEKENWLKEHIQNSYTPIERKLF
ncbi:MAG: hypothetical protein R6T89_05535 [Candidatus Syntrophosphaera sp.]